MIEEIKQIDNRENHFQCNICMETATNPVVTTCGHLYCWNCIYHWLGSHQQYLSCPVCKSGIQASKLIPLTGRTDNDEIHQQGFPSRPKPKRNHNNRRRGALPSSIANLGMNLQRGVLLAGYGLFPSLAILLFQKNSRINDVTVVNSPQMKYQKILQMIVFVLTIMALCIIIMT